MARRRRQGSLGFMVSTWCHPIAIKPGYHTRASPLYLLPSRPSRASGPTTRARDGPSPTPVGRSQPGIDLYRCAAAARRRAGTRLWLDRPPQVLTPRSARCASTWSGRRAVPANRPGELEAVEPEFTHPGHHFTAGTLVRPGRAVGGNRGDEAVQDDDVRRRPAGVRSPHARGARSNANRVAIA